MFCIGLKKQKIFLAFSMISLKTGIILAYPFDRTTADDLAIQGANAPPALLSLQCRHNEHNYVSNHRRLDCLFNRLFRWRLRQTSNFRVTGLCEVNSPVIGEFPAQRVSNPENVSIWWRHHDPYNFPGILGCQQRKGWICFCVQSRVRCNHSDGIADANSQICPS